MQFFPIEFPPARVALRLTGKSFELRRVLIRIGLARKLLQVVPHQLIHTGAQRFRMSPGLTNDLIVERKELHSQDNITCARNPCQSAADFCSHERP